MFKSVPSLVQLKELAITERSVRSSYSLKSKIFDNSLKKNTKMYFDSTPLLESIPASKQTTTA